MIGGAWSRLIWVRAAGGCDGELDLGTTISGLLLFSPVRVTPYVLVFLVLGVMVCWGLLGRVFRSTPNAIGFFVRIGRRWLALKSGLEEVSVAGEEVVLV